MGLARLVNEDAAIFIVGYICAIHVLNLTVLSVGRSERDSGGGFIKPDSSV